jgi:hypothetical protein
MGKYQPGVKRYRICGEEVFADYIGRERGFECCVCRKGCNAYCFNILHGISLDEAKTAYEKGDYETWGFGPDHLWRNVEAIDD